MSQAEIQELPIHEPAEAPEADAPVAPVEAPEADAPVAPVEAPEADEPPTPLSPKRKRGRPLGSKNVKEPKAKPAVKPKAKGKKPPAPPPTEDEEMPQYVQQSLPPQDLAAQLFSLMRDHERQRVDRKRALYASWMSRF